MQKASVAPVNTPADRHGRRVLIFGLVLILVTLIGGGISVHSLLNFRLPESQASVAPPHNR